MDHSVACGGVTLGNECERVSSGGWVWVSGLYRGTSLIRNRRPPQDPRKALGMSLL